jgi:hypothetical protein
LHMHSSFMVRFQINGPISKTEIEEVEKKLQYKFPADYVEFMMEANGGEGSIGISFLRLWKMEEIIEGNNAYDVYDIAPGFILIGSDGGGAAFGYDFRYEKPKLVEVYFVGMDIDSPFYSTEKFSEFIEYLYNHQE